MSRRKEKFTDLIYFQLRLFVRFILRLCFHLEIDGLHYLESQPGPVILAGNHTGWLDSLIICAASKRRVRFLVIEWVMKLPVLGAIIRAFGGISVRPQKGSFAIEEAVKCLAQGDDICIFPEGKLSLDGNIADFRSGVARIQNASKCPVVPFAIYGGYEAWSYNQLLPRFCKIAIHFGVPLERLELETIEKCRELRDIVTYMKSSLDRRHGKVDKIDSSLIDLIQSKSDSFSARPALCLKERGGKWNEVSYAELSRRSQRLSSYLIEAGIRQGDNIMILSEWRPELAVCLFASWRVGATVVSLNSNADSTTLDNAIAECHPKAIFVSAKTAARLNANTRSQIPQLCFLLNEQLTGSSQLPTISNLKPRELHANILRSPEEIALITYTFDAGTQRTGIMTTFQNILFQAELFQIIANPKEGERFLAVQPLNQLLWLMHGLLSVLYAGGTVYFSSSTSTDEVTSISKERELTGIIAGADFYKSLRSHVEQRFESSSRKLLARNNLSKELSPRLKFLLHDGTSVSDTPIEFFRRLGIPILSSYSVPEASSVIACNTPEANKEGSAGKIAPGIELKITNGEICTRGPHLMKGYFPNGKHTNVDEDGWLHTGDLGEVDSEGYLHVLGKLNAQEST